MFMDGTNDGRGVVRAAAMSILLIAALPVAAGAAGFQLMEQGASGLGRAYAGAAAVADDASTVFFNPAGLALLERGEVVAVASAIDHAADFTATTAVDVAGNDLSGGRSTAGGELSLVPAFYHAQPLDGRLTFGLGVNVPFGLGTDYGPEGVTRYQAVTSRMKSVNINPALGWRVGERWAFGLGLNLMYMDVKLTNAIDHGAACLALTAPATCAGLGLLPQQTDGRAAVEGDGWGRGWNIGAIRTFGRSRVGLHYRSRVALDLKGGAAFAGTPELFRSLGIFVDTGASASVTTPETISLAVAHPVGDRWLLTADIVRTGWSSFKELRITYGSNQPDTVEPQRWRDVFRYAVGLDYRLSGRWTLRGGLAFDEGPVGDGYRILSLPDGDRLWLALGATRRLGDGLTIDLGYAHIAAAGGAIDHTGSSGDRLTGTIDSGAHVFGAGLRYRF